MFNRECFTSLYSLGGITITDDHLKKTVSHVRKSCRERIRKKRAARRPRVSNLCCLYTLLALVSIHIVIRGEAHESDVVAVG